MPTYIWVLMQGEDYEGGHLISIYATEKSARKAAASFAPVEHGWKLHRQEADSTIWRDGGCSWVEIQQRLLLP